MGRQSPQIRIRNIKIGHNTCHRTSHSSQAIPTGKSGDSQLLKLVLGQFSPFTVPFPTFFSFSVTLQNKLLLSMSCNKVANRLRSTLWALCRPMILALLVSTPSCFKLISQLRHRPFGLHGQYNWMTQLELRFQTFTLFNFVSDSLQREDEHVSYEQRQ